MGVHNSTGSTAILYFFLFLYNYITKINTRDLMKLHWHKYMLILFSIWPAHRALKPCGRGNISNLVQNQLLHCIKSDFFIIFTGYCNTMHNAKERTELHTHNCYCLSILFALMFVIIFWTLLQLTLPRHFYQGKHLKLIRIFWVTCIFNIRHLFLSKLFQFYL